MDNEEEGGIWNFILIAILLGASLYAFHYFNKYEIEQQAKYEAQYCPPCKEKTNETPNE